MAINEPTPVYHTPRGNQYWALKPGTLPGAFLHCEVETILNAIGAYYDALATKEAGEKLLEAINSQFRIVEERKYNEGKADSLLA
jgi:hypothetical protein